MFSDRTLPDRQVGAKIPAVTGEGKPTFNTALLPSLLFCIQIGSSVNHFNVFLIVRGGGRGEQSRIHTHSHSLTHSFTHTLTHTHVHMHTHTHTHTVYINHSH